MASCFLALFWHVFVNLIRISVFKEHGVYLAGCDRQHFVGRGLSLVRGHNPSIDMISRDTEN